MSPTEVLATLQEITRAIGEAVEDKEIGIDQSVIYQWLRTTKGKQYLNDRFLELVQNWKQDRVDNALSSARAAAKYGEPVVISIPFNELVTQLGIVPHRYVVPENFPHLDDSGKIYHSFYFGFPTTQNEVIDYMRSVGYRPASVYELLCWWKQNRLSLDRQTRKYALGQEHDGNVVSISMDWQNRLHFELGPISKKIEQGAEFIGVYVNSQT